jgi:hypothetical protein
LRQQYGVEISFNRLLGDLSTLKNLADFIARELYSRHNKFSQKTGGMDDEYVETVLSTSSCQSEMKVRRDFVENGSTRVKRVAELYKKVSKENPARQNIAIKRIPRESRRMKP